MKSKFVKVMFFGALALSTVTYVGCKDLSLIHISRGDDEAGCYSIHIIYTVHLMVRLRIYVIIRNNPFVLYKK